MMYAKNILLTTTMTALLASFSTIATAGDAKMTLTCGDMMYHVSTGSDEGACAQEFGKEISLTCGDNDGNMATASCKSGCGDTNGKGDCQEEKVPPPEPPEGTGVAPEGTGEIPEGTGVAPAPQGTTTAPAQ